MTSPEGPAIVADMNRPYAGALALWAAQCLGGSALIAEPLRSPSQILALPENQIELLQVVGCSDERCRFRSDARGGDILELRLSNPLASTPEPGLPKWKSTNSSTKW